MWLVMQIKVNGSHYGEWGIQRYGAQSCKVGDSCLDCIRQFSILLPHNAQGAQEAQKWLKRRLSARLHGVPQVDELEFYRDRIQALAGAIKGASEHLLRNPDATLPAAFVTFTSRTSQASRTLVELRSVLHPLPCHQPQPSDGCDLDLSNCALLSALTVFSH